MKKIITILTVALLFLLPFQTRLIILPGSLGGTLSVPKPTLSVGGYFEYGTISLYGTEILLWLIVVLLIVQYFISKPVAAPGQGGRFKIFVSLRDIPRRGIFLFFGFLVFLFARPALLTLNYARLWLEGILIFLIIRGVGEKIYLIWAFIGGAALQAILGIYQFFSQSAFASKWLGMAAHDPSVLGTFVVETASGRWLRAYGAFPHPNILAGYLVAAILLIIIKMISHPLSLPLGQGEKDDSSPYNSLSERACLSGRQARNAKAGRGFGIIILPILSAGLFFTFSRGAWLALAVGLIIFLILGLRSYLRQFKTFSHSRECENVFRLGVWSLSVVLVIMAILTGIYWPLVSARTLADGRLEIKSSSERIGYYREAWTLIKNHPLIGVGLGNYTRAVHDEIDAARPASPVASPVGLRPMGLQPRAYGYQPVHNVFVLALAELGVIGIFLIAAAMFVLRKLIPWKKIIYFAPFAVIGLFDHYLWTLYPGILLVAVFSGLIFTPREAPLLTGHTRKFVDDEG
ncbi:MAG: O-antigen ligase family protein [Patescibacteria group bacterium]